MLLYEIWLVYRNFIQINLTFGDYENYFKSILKYELSPERIVLIKIKKRNLFLEKLLSSSSDFTP